MQCFSDFNDVSNSNFTNDFGLSDSFRDIQHNSGDQVKDTAAQLWRAHMQKFGTNADIVKPILSKGAFSTAVIHMRFIHNIPDADLHCKNQDNSCLKLSCIKYQGVVKGDGRQYEQFVGSNLHSNSRLSAPIQGIVAPTSAISQRCSRQQCTTRRQLYHLRPVMISDIPAMNLG